MAEGLISRGDTWITTQENKIYLYNTKYMEKGLYSNLVPHSSRGLSQNGLLEVHAPKVQHLCTDEKDLAPISTAEM